MTAAAIYSRFSTEKQRDASIDDQVRECERAATAAGLTVVARYEDRGISGGTHSRPGYQALLAGARRHDFDVIVCEDISRLWRNRAEFGPRSAELEDLGVHCLTCVGDDTRRDGWGLVVQIKQAMGEHARREASYRTRRGLEGRALAGQSTGGRAYGYIAVRDSGTGQIEVDPATAPTVRRIFELYASGVSPKNIAVLLNAEGVPSPGAVWNRTERRRDGQWLASTIHGDVNRGTGMLNNLRYIGVITWGRSEWRRSAADSKQRSMRMSAQGIATERTQERLRNVPQHIWDAVKARQQRHRVGVGALIRGGLRKKGGGAGRPPKYALSGLLLSCGVCGAAFTLQNRTSYCCATFWNGGKCSNTLKLSKALAEGVLLAGIQDDLTDPATVDEVERRAHAVLRERRGARPVPAARLKELQDQVTNLTDAIASGLLRASPALGERLQAAEQELARLQAQARAKPATMIPDVRGRWLTMVAKLNEVLMRGDPERARDELRGLLGERIKLEPDASGRLLWADYSFGLIPLEESAEIMVAGAGFEPATFGL